MENLPKILLILIAFLKNRRSCLWGVFFLIFTICLESSAFAVGVYTKTPYGTIYYLGPGMSWPVEVSAGSVPSNIVWAHAGDNYWRGEVPVHTPTLGPNRAELERQQRQAALERQRQAEAARLAKEQRIATALSQNAQVKARELESRRDSQFAKLRRDLDTEIAQTRALCFPGDTPVAVRDDSTQGYHSQAISEIRIGDSVVSCNLAVNGGICEFGQVQEVIQNTADHLVKLTFGGKTLKATDNHPFYVVDRKDWVEAQDLRIGDQLQSISGEVVAIEDIEIERGEVTVYNLDVQGNHNYYACDVLVHNCTIGATVGLTARIGSFGATAYNLASSRAGMGLGLASMGAYAAAYGLPQLGTALYTFATGPVGLTIAATGGVLYFGPKIYNYFSENNGDSPMRPVNGESASQVANGLRTPEQAGLSQNDITRIQNAADRTGQEITVVGSRANGTANEFSDYDYILSGNANQRHSARSSLPRGNQGGEIGRSGQESGIDIFQNYNPEAPGFQTVDPSRPHVIFRPRGQ